MQVLLFAGLAEALGTRTLEVDVEPLPATVGALEAWLREARPELASRPFRVAVDQRYGSADQLLTGAEELALIPPVSGG